MKRSFQVEGCFGIMKQDFRYDRFRMTHLENVSMELMLTTQGMNIRKYMNGVAEPKRWKAPADTKPQEFKKPSAKRLANRMNKKREKQTNEMARYSNKYNKDEECCKKERVFNIPFFLGLQSRK
ncbi:MAG: transposase [Candidatus Ornithospirochaeta sp.]